MKNMDLLLEINKLKKFIENGEADQEAFASNAERLEQRLSSLGLLKRLSDACAYVQNPFAVNL